MNNPPSGERGRRWGAPAFPRLERPGSDEQWREWLDDVPMKWVGSGKDKPDPAKRIDDALEDEDGFGGPFTKEQQQEKVDRKYQERNSSHE